MLVPQEITRYIKQILVDDIGIEGQQKLKQAKVLIIGAGGLGCPVAQYINAAGIGTIGVVEFDIVDASNLHRQILYGSQDVGKKKGAVMIEKLGQQNPFTNLIFHDEKLDEHNAQTLIAAYDLVIDGCDNFGTRYIVNDACVLLGKPLVYGSILGYEGQVAIFNYDGNKQLRDIFPEPPNSEDVPPCSENGVLATVPGIVGTIMAQAAIRVIRGFNDYKNQYVLMDTLSLVSTRLEY